MGQCNIYFCPKYIEHVLLLVTGSLLSVELTGRLSLKLWGFPLQMLLGLPVW